MKETTKDGVSYLFQESPLLVSRHQVWPKGKVSASPLMRITPATPRHHEFKAGILTLRVEMFEKAESAF